MSIVLSQIAAVFLILALGYVACRSGWLPLAASPALSKLLVNIAQPCLVFYMMEHQALEPEQFASVALAVALSLGIAVFSGSVGLVFVKALALPKKDWGIYIVCFAFTNNGFLGLPVAMSLSNDNLFFITMMINVPAILLLFGLGPLIVAWHNGKPKSVPEILRTVLNLPVLGTLLGLLFLTQGWSLPMVLDETAELLGAMMVPLSMLVIGMQLTQSRAGEVLRCRRHYLYCLLRLILLPLAALATMKLLGVPAPALGAVALYSAMPAATMAVIFAADCGANGKLAAETVFVSHLFAALTLPLWAAEIAFLLHAT
jgi:predicted permease